MKKIVVASVAVAVLLFTGCSQKNPEVDMTKQDQQTQNVGNNANANSNVNGMDSTNMDSATNDVNNMNNNGNSVKYLIAKLELKLKPVYFDFDKYNIRPDMKGVVEESANIFNSDEAQKLSIKIEGNCDEWGTDEYNYALGLKRAKSVKDELSALGVASDRMMVVSYGESNPVCTEHTKSCWDKNRRAEFKLLP